MAEFTLEEIYSRLQTDPRHLEDLTLEQLKNQLQEIWREREPKYSKLANITIEVHPRETLQDVVNKIIRQEDWDRFGQPFGKR